MANKTPVLASNAPGINAIIEHNKNGLLFTIGNGKELAANLKRLLTDDDLAARLATNAKHTLIDSYDHGKMLNRYRKMWNL
jgi:glycosyltransferase involved in cell wall biosynthesis